MKEKKENKSVISYNHNLLFYIKLNNKLIWRRLSEVEVEVVMKR